MRLVMSADVLFRQQRRVGINICNELRRARLADAPSEKTDNWGEMDEQVTMRIAHGNGANMGAVI
jgi:hypothetical protein